MDFFSGLLIAGIIGHSIWEALKESPEEKHNRERIERISAEKERKLQEAEEAERRKRQEAEEAELRERLKPFKTPLECFKEQYVSYTRIATYNSCPQRFKLIYMDKNAGDEDRYWYKGGTAFHEFMEYYFKQYIGSVIGSLDYNEFIKGRQWYFNEVWDEKSKKRRRKMVRFTCRTFPKNVEIVAVEKKLSFKANNIRFFGIVDLVLKYPDGTIEIVDFKTGLRLPIREQLESYSIPFTQYQDFSKIDFRVICPDRQSHYRWSLNREEVAERRKHILDIVNTIMNDNEFAPTINSACSRCSVRYACEHSGIHKKNQRVSNKNNRLTKLNIRYEWKQGVTPPKTAHSKPKSHGGKTKNKKKRDRGLSYSLSQAKNKYKCLKTGRPIKVGEYHFVNHHGKRFCVDSFSELYPKRAKQLIEKRQEVKS
ncbi:MAG: RecB family exonuclease [Planctomycetota bacterium]